MTVIKSIQQAGVLYVVATPIGNLDDISFRAVKILTSVDCIACEDTRHSQRLLQNFTIKTSLTAYHEHNEESKTAVLLDKLLAGESIALISDAGTPLVSDPGYRLISEAQKANIKVVPIPGACAAITALSAAGLASNQFIFAGFLPAKAKARRDVLDTVINESRTMIFYESPHRILASLEAMQEILGQERHVVIARELTKTYETIYSDSLENVITWINADSNQQRGEFVVLIKGTDKSQQLDKVEISPEQVLITLMKELPLKKAAKLAAEITGQRKNELYDLGLQLQ